MIRDITIKPLLNGYQVQVGCQTLCFTERDALLSELRSYLKDPLAVENHYRENALNARHFAPPPPPTSPMGNYAAQDCNTVGMPEASAQAYPRP